MSFLASPIGNFAPTILIVEWISSGLAMALAVKRDISQKFRCFYVYTCQIAAPFRKQWPHLAPFCLRCYKRSFISYLLITLFVNHRQVSFHDFLSLFKFWEFLCLCLRVESASIVYSQNVIDIQIGLLRQLKCFRFCSDFISRFSSFDDEETSSRSDAKSISAPSQWFVIWSLDIR
jgi:hypothetical protein